MSDSPCPKRSQIRDLIRDDQSIVFDDVLAEHLNHCSECQAELAALDGTGDSFVSAVQRRLDPDAIRAIPIFQEAIARLNCPPLDFQPETESSHRGDQGVGGNLGEFRIVREVTGGGMGRIYEAIQEPLGRRVALKTIRGDRLSPQKRERFLREQTVLAALHQTHIVPIHTAGQTGDLQYFAMPYIEGVTLQQIIANVRRQQSLFPNTPTPTLAKLARPADSTLLANEDSRATDPARQAKVAFPAPQGKFRLSMDYFRSVATVMLEAAEACHHVHDLQILHRDLKPSNLMVDTAGQCWIIDFGLAQFLSDGHSDESEGATRSADLSVRLRQHLTQEDARPGTPPYMAPEQWKKQPVDARTDVWGLGVTLYELLTLRPAFAGSLHDIECKVLSEDPPPAHSLVKSVPRDLEAVCGKALKKDPSARYQTAEEFASDLRHWLAHEPVTARRTRVPRRVWLWARRNRGWAAAIVFFFVACAGVAAGEIRSVRHRALEAERAIMLQRLQGARLMPHVSSRENNWLEDGWGLMRQAAQIRSDDALRDQAAAFLTGISASLAKVMEGFQSSAVAFDADGRRLLIGGGDHDEAKIWDSATDEFQKSGQKGSGPVAFGSDGAAWQLVATGQDHFPLLLWDVAKRRLSRELRLSAEFSGPANGEPRVSLMALAQTGRVAAAAAILKDRNTLLAAWDISDGKVVPQIRRAGREVSAIALSPEGDYLAAGDAKGQITIWPVRGGPAVSLPSARRAKLECLAFGRNRRGRVGNNNLDNWLIAGGDAGGTVTIWDLGRRAPATYCRGSYYDVYALAFSPDGATLASAGRHATRLWDIATGRPLLEFPRGDYMTGLAFSSDGNKVAVSTAPNRHFDSSQQGTMVWDLEHHRGMQALRGLDSQVAHSKVCFSHDGSRVAALSLGWEAAIWDLPSGFLHHLFQVAPGLTADNAGLEFSPDGHKFAVVAGSEARMWDLDTGQSISWQLPEGLVDTLVFDSTGKHLYSLRMETADWIHAPDSSSSYRDYPRVCRVRDLLATPERDLRRPRKKNPTWEAAVFKAGIVAAQASSDGRYLVAMGDPERPGEGRLLKVFQSETGKEVLSMPATGFCLDTTGTLMEFGPKSLPGNPLNSLIEIPSGKLVGFVDPPASSMGPLAHFSAAETATAFGFSLHRMGDPLPLVTLGIDIECSPRSTFNLDGTRLAWGNRDGTVTVCYLAEVQRRLAAIGFGW